MAAVEVPFKLPGSKFKIATPTGHEQPVYLWQKALLPTGRA